MTREDELKAELKALDAKKEAKQIKQNLDNMKLVGKHYASHQLNRYMTKKASYNFIVQKVIGKKHNPDSSFMPYSYKINRITVIKDGDTFKVDSSITYCRDGYLLNGYDITEKQFNTVKASIPPIIETAVNNIRNKFKANEHVSGGEYRDARQAHTLLDNMGIEFIDFADKKGLFYGSNIAIFEILRWQHHPFLFNSRLYKVTGWDSIVKSILNTMKTDASSWGGGIWDRDAPRIKMLEDFIKKEIK